MHRFAELTFFVSLLPPVILFFLYPAALYLLGRRRAQPPFTKPFLPSLSFIVVVRNAEETIAAKIRNILSLDYPPELLEIIISNDGSTDDTAGAAGRMLVDRGVLLTHPEHRGKNAAFNDAVAAAKGELVVLSDADSVLQDDSLKELTRPFASGNVGGASGKIVISKDRRAITSSQRNYWKYDSLVKTLESRLGFLTSNTGALCAFRRDLFDSIPDGVTDDLFVALTVIRKERMFLFAPEAHTVLQSPSKSFGHEILRRRRIVSQSLRGIYLVRGILNPFRSGYFSLCLLTNKVLRRLLPLFIVSLFLSSAFLAHRGGIFALAFSLQAAFYAMPMLLLLPDAPVAVIRRLRKAGSLSLYFLAGNAGTLLGLLDFFAGKTVTRWEPAVLPPS